MSGPPAPWLVISPQKPPMTGALKKPRGTPHGGASWPPQPMPEPSPETSDNSVCSPKSDTSNRKKPTKFLGIARSTGSSRPAPPRDSPIPPLDNDSILLLQTLARGSQAHGFRPKHPGLDRIEVPTPLQFADGGYKTSPPPPCWPAFPQVAAASCKSPGAARDRHRDWDGLGTRCTQAAGDTPKLLISCEHWYT
jgi:hypothetical protein